MRCSIEITVTELDSSDERYAPQKKVVAKATADGELVSPNIEKLSSYGARAVQAALVIMEGKVG